MVLNDTSSMPVRRVQIVPQGGGTPRPASPRWFGRGLSISLLTHLGLLAVSLLIVWELDAPPDVLLTAGFQEKMDHPVLVIEPEHADTPHQAENTDSSSVIAEAVAAVVSTINRSTTTAPVLRSEILSAELSATPEMDATIRISAPASSATGAAATAGSGHSSGPGSNGGASFFGYRTTANSVAFVLDASGSMTGPRFTRALAELDHSLTQLQPEQTFYVVFFTDETFPLFWPNSQYKLLPATPQNLMQARAWLRMCRTDGGTKPMRALNLALRLQPDVVYFLSDGDIPLKTRDVAQTVNRGSIIHTISLGAQDVGEVMLQIADDHQGTYRFIPDLQ